MSHFDIFGLKLRKTIFKMQKSACKIKKIKFWTKNVLFGYFRPEFEKTIAKFEINTLEFIKIRKFTQG